MHPYLTCTCGGETWEAHTEFEVTIDAAVGSRGAHVPPGVATATVVRCTSCSQPMADVLEQEGLLAT